MTFGSLFSGIGGLDLGLERAGMKCRWQVEIDPFCRKVLTKHWPEVPKYGDIRELRESETVRLEKVDLVAGGFPCQDISHAGPRIGINGPRSGLWKDMAAIICQIQPRIVVVENVSALADRGLSDVLGDLARFGFDCEWACLSACAFGAPHPRERLFIVAYAEGQRPRQLRRLGGTPESPSKWNIHWPQPEPSIHRVAHGVPNRVDRLRGLGNAVVPQVAQWIGERIMKVAA